MTHLPGERPTRSELLPDGRTHVAATAAYHLAGLVLVPTIAALNRLDVLAQVRDASGPMTLADVARASGGNAAYLRVALRALASAGWLLESLDDDRRTVSYTVSSKGRQLLAPCVIACYEEAARTLPMAARMEQILSGEDEDAWTPVFQECERRIRDGWRPSISEEMGEELSAEVRAHLDGMLVVPTMAVLSRAGLLDLLAAEPATFERLGPTLECMFDLLTARDWATHDGDRIVLTPVGREFAGLASFYALIAAYLPTLTRLEALLRGDRTLQRVDDNGDDLLIDRLLHVWALGGVVRSYLSAVDPVIEEIFNRPIEQQPLGVCDSRCGDGTLLEHVYRVVQRRTLRGQHLEDHPLLLVGADPHRAARQATKQRLENAGIHTYQMLRTDGSRPGLLGSELERRGIDIHELVHVRSFEHQHWPCGWRKNLAGDGGGRTTGAFAHRGRTIAADAVEESLVCHFRRWKPYIGHGLLAVAFHTIPPDAAARDGAGACAVALDAVYGYSDQLLMELWVVLECARAAGLQADERYRAPVAAPELAMVSVNYFTASREGAL